MIKEIVKHTDHILREEMPAFDFKNPIMDSVQLYTDLAETMRENDGMGLAANQIGVRTRAFVLRGEDILGIFNPRVVDTSTEMVLLEEGCLSYPSLLVKIKRPKTIKVRYTTPDGETTTKTFTGITARVFLHELDHLDGIIHTTRANRYHLDQARNLVKKINNRYQLNPLAELSEEAKKILDCLQV